MFAPVKMRVKDMRHINIIMQKGHRTFPAEEHIGVFIQEAAHQFFGSNIILQQLRRRFNRVKQKDPQVGFFFLIKSI